MTDRSVLVAGETLVDFIPGSSGPLATVETFDRRAGGAPANVAVGLARLGAPPWLCTTLSTDPFGEFLAERLATEGLPDRFVARVDRPTALAFVAHGPDADREFTFYREGTADLRLRTDAIDDQTLSRVDRVVLGGVALSAEPARSAALDLARRARRAGCRVVFDPNTRPELWHSADVLTADLRRMLRLTDLLVAAQADFEPTAVPTDDGLAGRLLAAGPDSVVLTAGADGASAVAGPSSPWGQGEWHHPGYDPETVADTTGAGDAFLAGLLAALIDGTGPEAALAFANAVAAVATTDSGGMRALPDAAAVDRFRGRHA